MNNYRIFLSTLVAAASFLFGQANAQLANSFSNPFASRASASSISEAPIVEMPLDGTGAYLMTWAGVAQFGHGPMQLVIELPRGNKWLGASCLKFINMQRKGDAYVSVTGGYVFTYESTPIAASGSYANQPDPGRFTQFERFLKIQKEDSVWEASTRMHGIQRQMRWTSDQGEVQVRNDVVASMKQLQNSPHCTI